MAKIELGRIGAAIGPGAGEAFLDTVIELEDAGYQTIWLAGGQLESLEQVAAAVRATREARIGVGIISVDRFDADAVAALYTELEGTHPGRFVVGLGGAHGPDPFATLTAYLDRLTAVPPTAQVLAALGPRMLDLARERAAGAYPVLVTPEYSAQARGRLGTDTTLAVDQLAVLETDPERARTIARGPLGFLGTLPAYRANFHRMGFTDEEIGALSDRLVDALIVWGDADAIAARVFEHLDAGADHVAIGLTIEPTVASPLDQWRSVASALL
jgi:probable F420-dependent oxidoreductase